MRRAVAAFVSPLESSPPAVLRRAVAGLLVVYAGLLLLEGTVSGNGVSPVAILMMGVCVAIWREWGGRSVRDWGLVLVCFLGYAAGANALPDIGMDVHFTPQIDAVWVDRDLNVLKVSHDVAPWRTAACKGAKGVVEMAAGEAKRLGVSAGDKLTLQ